MSLYDDAQAEYGNRNGSLTITYNSVVYNPYDFVNDSQFNSFYNSACLEQGANTRTVFLSDSTPSNVMTLSNSNIITLKRLALNAVQKLRDGYNFILGQISNGTITMTSQIVPAWNAYDSTYVSGRVTVPTNDTLNNTITALAATVSALPGATQADWSQSNTAAPDYIKNKPTVPAAMSSSQPTRVLNTAYQPSSTRNTLVLATVDITCTLTLTGGAEGRVYLDIASNNTFTNNLQTFGPVCNGNSGALTIGLNLTQKYTGSINGFIPAGYYYRLRSVNTTGTPTFGTPVVQEISM